MSKGRGIRYRVTAALGKVLIRAIELPIRLAVPDRAVFDSVEFDWVTKVEQRWEDIRGEYDRLAVEPQVMPDIRDISEEQRPVIEPGRWTFFPLRVYGIDLPERQERCPVTAEVIRGIPGCTTAFFSVLRPGAYIQPHRGAFKGYLRLHLGVTVPGETDKCGIRIGSNTYHWEEGRTLIFDDTFMHDAFNNADSERVVLYVDFIRPMPRWLRWFSDRLTVLIARSAYVQNVLRNLRSQSVQSPNSLA